MLDHEHYEGCGILTPCPETELAWFLEGWVLLLHGSCPSLRCYADRIQFDWGLKTVVLECILHEYRVTADAGPRFPPYEHVFRHRDSAEAKRQANDLLTSRGFRESTTDRKLEHRVIHYGEWMEVH